MTLDTRMIVSSPMAVRDVFDFARGLIGATDQYSFEQTLSYDKHNKMLSMNPGQGLPGWLILTYGADGPLQLSDYQTNNPDGTELDSYGDAKQFQPVGFIEISLDTAYGYRGETSGASCSDLHAAFVAAIGLWLNRQGKDWWWKDEFYGQWHHQHEGLFDFGDIERGWADLHGVSQAAPTPIEGRPELLAG